MLITLKPSQRDVLQKMRDGADVCSCGITAYVENDRISIRTINGLLALALIKGERVGTTYYYSLNQSAERLLAGETKIYQASDGSLHETIEDVVAYSRKLRENV